MSAMDPTLSGTEAHDLANRRWHDLKTARSQHEQMWTEIARIFRPYLGGFGLTDPAARQIEKPMSSAPIYAADSFAATLYGTMTNPANRWFGFQTNDDDLNADPEARRWMDIVTNRVLASFGPAISPYYSTAMQVFGSLSVLGNAAEYDELVQEEQRIMDVSVSLAEIVVDIDAFGRVCEVVRRFMLTPGQAAKLFRGRIPAKLLELAGKGSVERFAFFHHVLQNDDWMPGRRLGPRGKAWLSRYTCEEGRMLVREAGYDEMPFHFTRWHVDTGQTYGLGPGFVALPAARIHNRMDDAIVRRAQMAADPTLLAPDRDTMTLNGVIRPGKVVYGGVDMQGRQMLRPLELSGAVGLTLQDRQEKLQEVKDAFHFTLTQLVGRTGMTATEVATINEERTRLWAPHQGRVQTEYLAPKIERRFSILWRAGQLPPPPDRMRGAALDVKYESAAEAAQRSSEGTAAMRMLEDLAPLIGIKPRIADRIDEDGLVEVLAAARGAPGRMLRSREDADAIAAARQQQEQAMMAMQAMQQGAGAMKDMAGAEAAMAGAGQGGAV
jgi:hypothetical protein